jgi:hypothetical protein
MYGPFRGQLSQELFNFVRLTILPSPFTRYSIVPFGGRSTAIRMKDGGVWLLASTPLDDGTKSTLDNLGPVR